MALVHGRDAAIWLTDSGGTQRNLTTFCDSISTGFSRDTADTSTFGVGHRTYTGGIQDTSLSLGGKWDNGGTATPDQWLIGLIQAAGTVSSTFVVAPHGSASGKPYYTGTCFITDYSPDIPVDDVITWSAEFTVSGTPTRGTF